MAATGNPVFDGIAIMTVQINVLQKGLTSEAAFINTRTGATHGWTKGEATIWSEETKQIAFELVASMERDFARLHFGTSSEAPAAKSTNIGGLGEHLDDSDPTRSV